MTRWLLAVALGLLAVAGGRSETAPADGITWLVEYDGSAPPAGPTWTARGEPKAAATAAGLHLRDESDTGDGSYRAAWKPDPKLEVVVEATLKLGKTTGAIKGKAASVSVWPWRDGAPVGLLVSDGRHQDGLVFSSAGRVTTFTDRSILMDPTDGFHTYRLVIRGTDMSVAVDGEVRAKGQGAFQRPAPSPEAFVQFGSNAKYPTGDAVWKSVRLGVRTPAGPPPAPLVKVTLSPPWPITRPDLKTKPTRPYVYNVGRGKLLMSVAEGPDAIHEPYGVMLSADEGKTWAPVKGLDDTPYAPLPMARLKDGTVVGGSRWTWVQPDRSLRGRTVRWDADLSRFDMVESRLTLPPEYAGEKVPLTCERQLYEEADGSLLMAAYSKTGPSTPEGLRTGRRYSHLLRSADGGRTWGHHAVIGPGGEPAVAKTGGDRMTAVLRTGPFKPFHQVFSEDGGKTWSAPVLLEEGSVCADLVPMSNGLLACSYGRPANGLMFSADGGKTWASHHLVTDRTGFNYSGIVEVRPGRLLYVHDAGGLQALYVDVERVGR